MVGGTHADHSHVEAWLGITLGAATKPFTDAQVDAMCIAAEALITTELEPSNSLPATADTGWRQIVVALVISMMERGDKWQRSRGATTESSSEQGSATFAEFAADVMTPRIRARIKNYERRMTTAYSIRYGESQD
jgi:hypothetical protein